MVPGQKNFGSTGRQGGRSPALRFGFYWTVPSLLFVSAMFRASQNMAQTSFALVGRDILHFASGRIGAMGALSGATMMFATAAVGTKVPTGRSPLMVVIGAVLLTISLLVFGLLPSPGAFVIAVTILGIAGGLALPSLATAIGHFANERRERALAVYTLVLSVSLALGPLAETGVLIISREHLLAPFVAFAALPVSSVALRLRHRSNPSNSPSVAPPAASTAILASTEAGSSNFRSKFERRTGFVFTSPPGRLAITVQLLYAVPFAAITVFGALVARVVYGQSPSQAQLSFTVFFTTSLASRAVIAWRSPITKKFPVLAVSALLTLVGLGLLASGRSEWALMVAMGLLGIPHGVTFPLALSLVAQSSEGRALAGANAALFTTSNLAAIISPGLLGWLGQAIGYRDMLGLVTLPVLFFGSLMWRQRGYCN